MRKARGEGRIYKFLPKAGTQEPEPSCVKADHKGRQTRRCDAHGSHRMALVFVPAHAQVCHQPRCSNDFADASGNGDGGRGGGDGGSGSGSGSGSGPAAPGPAGHRAGPCMGQVGAAGGGRGSRQLAHRCTPAAS